MLYKDICYLELWQPLCSVEKNYLCNFGGGNYEKQFCENILNLDQWLRRRVLAAFFAQQSEIICKGCYEEQFCEIILNMGQWFRCRLKDFLSGALAALLFGCAICAILKERIMGNIHVK